MVEVCRSRAIDKTNLFLLAYLHATGLELTKKRIARLIKETKIKTSLLSLTLQPGKKVKSVEYIFLLSEKTRTQNKRWAGFNNNFDFDDCSHKHSEFSVPGN